MKAPLLLICISLSLSGFGQPYKTAAGIQFTNDNVGLSVQQKVAERYSVEGVAGKKAADWTPTKALNTSTMLSATVRRHKYLKGRAFNGYVGVGGQKELGKNAGDGYGVNGVIGLEGTIFYLNTSVDYRPIVTFQNQQRDYHGQLTLSLRYVLMYAPYKNPDKRKGGYTKPPYKPVWI